jgi:class 3 adenylate cyclase
MKRKIAAILAADAVEYSRLVAEDEDETLRQLVASIGVFRTSIEAHGGRIFNTAGDAVLAEFQSAVEAVRSAIDIQHALSARNEACVPGRRMMFRMGISIGDVVENEGDLLGDGVNIAARLQSLAQPGGLAISRWVQEQVAGKVTAEFRDTGYQLVRNMPAPIHVFQSNITGAAAPADVEVPRIAPPATPARQWPLRSAAVGVAALVIAVVFFAVFRQDHSGVAVREIPSTSAARENPVPVPAALQPPSDQPSFGSPPRTIESALPERPAEPKAEPAPIEAAAPPSIAPPPTAALTNPTLPTVGGQPATSAPEKPPEFAPPVLTAPVPEKSMEAALPPPAPAQTPAAPVEAAAPAAPATSPQEPAQAALPSAPVASPPESSPATALQQDSSPDASSPAPARETAADRKRQKVQCAQVLERAQLGDLTSDDKAFLRNKCR